MLELKTYQKRALETLDGFLHACRSASPSDAFNSTLAEQDRANERYLSIFDSVPCVCLRIPTGGGKTLLAAHCVAVAGKAMLDSDSPIALWLTPSETIRTQTLAALSDARHPYRQALGHHFGDRVHVCDLESVQTISPHDVGKACIVVVATIQSFNVTDTAKRNVYSVFEEMTPHFVGLSGSVTEGLERIGEVDLQNQPYLAREDLGQIKSSLANWFHLARPVLIVDEAHNNRTDRFFKTLDRLNPSCIIELTATPVPGNNVLYQVSAQELKAEQMIKLPIVLAEHPQGWRECLRDSVLTRDRLEVLAQLEEDYLRPITLIQAMPKGGEATVDVVRDHLLLQEKIPSDQIAIATGLQKELAGVDLFSRDCPIRFVITVEALREGWDCSFAYVLASLQSINSAKDVEQLLGRVLRMPYAKNRSQDALNRAYCHVVAQNFAEAAANLKDRMVQNMGFERLETNSLIVPKQGSLWERSGADISSTAAERVPDTYLTLPNVPDSAHWPDELRSALEIHKTTQGATVLLRGDISANTLAQAESFITQSVPEAARGAVQEQFAAHRAIRQSLRAPAQLGQHFAPIPQLCLQLEGHHELVEAETLAELGALELLATQIQLAGFSILETLNSFEIDLNGAKITYRHIDAQQLKLNEVVSHASEADLIRWLDAEVRRPFVSQLELQAYLSRMVTHLTKDRGFTLTGLVRARFQLAQAIANEIERLRRQAITRGFQRALPTMTVAPLDQEAPFSFHFHPGQYPARRIYHGSYEFNKHFYPMIHGLSEKTGSGKRSEEFLCAQAIDSNPKVKHWVRNIERQEKFSFWFPTSTDYFYPDFVVELNDGRLLVIEYKGEVYKTNDDSREKNLIGQQWEASSAGRCLFLFAVAEDDAGRSIAEQIRQKIG